MGVCYNNEYTMTILLKMNIDLIKNYDTTREKQANNRMACSLDLQDAICMYFGGIEGGEKGMVYSVSFPFKSY